EKASEPDVGKGIRPRKDPFPDPPPDVVDPKSRPQEKEPETAPMKEPDKKGPPDESLSDKPKDPPRTIGEVETEQTRRKLVGVWEVVKIDDAAVDSVGVNVTME